MKKSSKNPRKIWKQPEAEDKNKSLMKDLEEKNKKISSIENHNTRLNLIKNQATEVADKTARQERIVAPKETPTQQKKLCTFENRGTCKRKEQCQYRHPRITCQSYSRHGSCSDESSCEWRHPRTNCFQFSIDGSCSFGEKC